ncbi:uncharacterized protein LOC117112432 [Anneissia japonica]|uniref:uncharacterized protein LOC117112432 n=1 Tax=Anneissia japonica TaxID=1529436 RepID=UPI001425AF19|nr:uncharacterized protein LOC117112432 [Anneissia japonica]
MDLKRVLQNDTKLEKSKDTSLRDIDNIVQEMINKIKENGDEMENKVETIYKQKKRVTNMQTDELKTKISDIEIQLSVLNQLLNSDKTTAMKSSDMIITELKNKLEEQTSKTEPEDVGKIDIIKNTSLLQWKCSIGSVIKTKADCLKLMGGEDVTQSAGVSGSNCDTDTIERLQLQMARYILKALPCTMISDDLQSQTQKTTLELNISVNVATIATQSWSTTWVSKNVSNLSCKILCCVENLFQRCHIESIFRNTKKRNNCVSDTELAITKFCDWIEG